jgi:hypothetical protein
MTFFLSRNPLKSSALWAAGEKKCPATLSARVLQFRVETAVPPSRIHPHRLLHSVFQKSKITNLSVVALAKSDHQSPIFPRPPPSIAWGKALYATALLPLGKELLSSGKAFLPATAAPLSNKKPFLPTRKRFSPPHKRFSRTGKQFFPRPKRFFFPFDTSFADHGIVPTINTGKADPLVTRWACA